jgi:hypothetical protein
MRPVLAPRVSGEAAQGDLEAVAQEELAATREVMPVVEAVKENLAVAVARELMVAAKEDPAVVREATEAEVAAKKELAEVADGEDRGEKIRISQINTESKGKK